MIKKIVRVSNPKDPEQYSENEFWIVTGALYSHIPEDWLEKIHLEPSGTRNIIFADGRTDKRLFGYCNFEVEGMSDITTCPVILCKKGSLFLLGATVLENFGVKVDPTTMELKPILSIIGGFLESA